MEVPPARALEVLERIERSARLRSRVAFAIALLLVFMILFSFTALIAGLGIGAPIYLAVSVALTIPLGIVEARRARLRTEIAAARLALERRASAALVDNTLTVQDETRTWTITVSRSDVSTLKALPEARALRSTERRS